MFPSPLSLLNDNKSQKSKRGEIEGDGTHQVVSLRDIYVTHACRPRWVDEQVQTRVIAGSNGFNAIEYVELRTVRLRNKMKFLCFHEDYRPPYFGTFSKTSKLLSGRSVKSKDYELFNYDTDSEAGWDEEEEEGEDLGESDGGDEEPDDIVYDDFFCKDDDLGSDAVRSLVNMNCWFDESNPCADHREVTLTI